jgi:hypothetical protein
MTQTLVSRSKTTGTSALTSPVDRSPQFTPCDSDPEKVISVGHASDTIVLDLWFMEPVKIFQDYQRVTDWIQEPLFLDKEKPDGRAIVQLLLTAPERFDATALTKWFEKNETKYALLRFEENSVRFLVKNIGEGLPIPDLPGLSSQTNH